MRFLWISRNDCSNLSRFMGFKVFFKTSASLFGRNFLVQENDLYVPSFLFTISGWNIGGRGSTKYFFVFFVFSSSRSISAARYATCLKVEMCVSTLSPRRLPCSNMVRNLAHSSECFIHSTSLAFCFSIVIIRWLAPFFSSFTFRYSLMNRGSSSWYWSASLMTAIAWFGFGCKSVLIGSICNLFINFKNFGNMSQFPTVSSKIRF